MKKIILLIASISLAYLFLTSKKDMYQADKKNQASPTIIKKKPINDKKVNEKSILIEDKPSIENADSSFHATTDSTLETDKSGQKISFRKFEDPFPSLDAFQWRYKKKASERGFPDVLEKILLKKITDLKYLDSISFSSEFSAQLLDSISNKNSNKYHFQKRKYIAEPETFTFDKNLPVCAIKPTVFTIRSIDKLTPENWVERVKNVEPVELKNELLSGFKINFVENMGSRNSHIESVECYLFTNSPQIQYLNDLLIIHLNATLGI